MSESSEQKEAFDKVDDLVDEAGWREERKWFFGGWLGLRRWPFWSKTDPPAGGPGLRDALHGDDEKS